MQIVLVTIPFIHRTAETFLKYSNRSLQYFTSHPQSQSTFRGPDAKVKAILEKLLNQENRVLDYWTQKKKRLDQAQQFCLFERSARQSLAWIKEEGDNYLATHTEVTQVKYSSSACTIFQMTMGPQTKWCVRKDTFLTLFYMPIKIANLAHKTSSFSPKLKGLLPNLENLENSFFCLVMVRP